MPHAIRGHITADNGVALNNSILPNMDKLMEGTATTKKHMIRHFNMPSDEHIIGEHIVASHLNIVGKMNTRHQKIGMPN